MKKVQCATKALIVKDGKFLVFKRKVGEKIFTDIPGGRMEYGLSPEENLLREIKEELDMNVEIEKIVGIWYFFREVDNIQIICITYLCKPLNEEINIKKNPDKDENIVEYMWLTPEEFLELETDHFNGIETLKKLVKDCFRI